MSADEYAAMQLAFGGKLIESGGVWWRQVRPLFYRPLLVYRELHPETLRYPSGSLVGGAQHAVPEGVRANSSLNLLLFEDPGNYSLEGLTRNKRYQLRWATRTCAVRRITDVDNLIAEAHPVYLSFYERTKYGYKQERTDEQHFAAWARTLFSFPKVLVLGAYRQEELCR